MPFRSFDQSADTSLMPPAGANDDDLFRLSGSVGEQGDNDRQDVIKAQILFGNSGHFDLPGLGGPTGWPSEGLTRGMRGYQKDRGLTVDGIMLPGGETLDSLNSELGDRLAGEAVPTPDEVDSQHARRVQQLAQDEPAPSPFTSNAAEGPRSRDKATGLSLSEQGLGAIKGYEKFRGIVYPDQAGHLTVGYGHKLQPGEDKQFAAEIDDATAMALLVRDAAKAEKTVQGLVETPLSQQEYDALVSLVYNIGPRGFAGSTVLQQLNKGDYQGAANAMLMWDRITQQGKKVPSRGLATRRSKERGLFLNGDYK